MFIYDIRCVECDTELQIDDASFDRDGDISCKVTLCPTCIERAQSEAKEQEESEWRQVVEDLKEEVQQLREQVEGA